MSLSICSPIQWQRTAKGIQMDALKLSRMPDTGNRITSNGKFLGKLMLVVLNRFRFSCYNFPQSSCDYLDELRRVERS